MSEARHLNAVKFVEVYVSLFDTNIAKLYDINSKLEYNDKIVYGIKFITDILTNIGKNIKLYKKHIKNINISNYPKALVIDISGKIRIDDKMKNIDQTINFGYNEYTQSLYIIDEKMKIYE
jgi:hypothetical protein